MTLEQSYEYLDKVLDQAEKYYHAASIMNFDLETICPPDAMEQEGNTIAFLTNQGFQLKKDSRFMEAIEVLYAGRDQLDEYRKALAESLHRELLETRRMTPEMDHAHSVVYNKAYVDWLEAKEASDFSKFAPSLEAVRKVSFERVSVMEEAKPLAYDNLLNLYELGMTQERLDYLFAACTERLVPLLKKIRASKKQIRRDFLTRPVTDSAQEEFAYYLLETMKFDFNRGLLSTTEHPFTDSPAQFDHRVTTHYDPNAFVSSMYSVIHEGGHALFDQNQPADNWKYHIDGNKTMGQHESVSRFYENLLGRSEAFVNLVFDKAKALFPDVLSDVTPRELYEAVNIVEPSLIRTEADEFTYVFHIIIRYEIEKMIMEGKVQTADLPKLWDDMYEKYLGIRPGNAKEGILQDVHWTGGFGYFPTYALGNFYNAMYYNEMNKAFSVEEAVAAGDFDRINGWMRDHVFAKADRLEPALWIRDITGRDLTPDDFLDYLEKKYTKLYEL